MGGERGGLGGLGFRGRGEGRGGRREREREKRGEVFEREWGYVCAQKIIMIY